MYILNCWNNYFIDISKVRIFRVLNRRIKCSHYSRNYNHALKSLVVLNFLISSRDKSAKEYCKNNFDLLNRIHKRYHKKHYKTVGSVYRFQTTGKILVLLEHINRMIHEPDYRKSVQDLFWQDVERDSDYSNVLVILPLSDI